MYLSKVRFDTMYLLLGGGGLLMLIFFFGTDAFDVFGLGKGPLYLTLKVSFIKITDWSLSKVSNDTFGPLSDSDFEVFVSMFRWNRKWRKEVNFLLEITKSFLINIAVWKKKIFFVCINWYFYVRNKSGFCTVVM